MFWELQIVPRGRGWGVTGEEAGKAGWATSWLRPCLGHLRGMAEAGVPAHLGSRVEERRV